MYPSPSQIQLDNLTKTWINNLRKSFKMSHSIIPEQIKRDIVISIQEQRIMTQTSFSIKYRRILPFKTDAFSANRK